MPSLPIWRSSSPSGSLSVSRTEIKELLVWPPIQGALTSAGTAIADIGSFGTFFYGFLLRLTGAVGLHHTIYPLFWYSSLGGSEVVAGQTVAGAQNIFFGN